MVIWLLDFDKLQSGCPSCNICFLYVVVYENPTENFPRYDDSGIVVFSHPFYGSNIIYRLIKLALHTFILNWSTYAFWIKYEKD